jgi:hypothetical protein
VNIHDQIKLSEKESVGRRILKSIRKSPNWLWGWIYVPPAEINEELRHTFEQYGTFGLQVLLGTNTALFQHEKRICLVQPYKQEMFDWLTEQSDRAKRKEHWSMAMEFLVTIFVAGELLFVVLPSWLAKP